MMTLESIRYYTTLGIKVLLYDNHGQNYNALYNASSSPYYHDDRYSNIMNNIVYYNYTIRGSMRNESIVFDNNDLSTKVTGIYKRMEKSDKDKVCHVILYYTSIHDVCVYILLYSTL